MAVARYLADKSALARLSHASVAARLSPLLESGLVATRVVLLHYDRDFDVVAAVTGRPAQWVVPPGSVR